MRLFKLLIALLLLTTTAFADDFETTKAKWESNMLSFGQQNCTALASTTINDDNLNRTYYDGERIFYQIADYTNDATWNQCAQRSEYHYKDYVKRTGGNAAAYWVFPHGLSLDFKRTSDATSSEALDALAANASYCRGTAYELGALPDPALQREAAYCLMLMIEQKRLGKQTPFISNYLGFVKQHLRKQFVDNTTPYHQPFMVALGAEALIQYNRDITKDPEILPLLQAAASALWSKDWDFVSKSFKYYQNAGASWEPSLDLNLLIVPMYGWLYKQTGDSTYRLMGDQIFEYGVNGAWLVGGKQFNQNYRSSFNYVEWRQAAAPTPQPTATPVPTPKPCSMALTHAGFDCRLKKLEAK